LLIKTGTTALTPKAELKLSIRVCGLWRRGISENFRSVLLDDADPSKLSLIIFFYNINIQKQLWDRSYCRSPQSWLAQLAWGATARV